MSENPEFVLGLRVKNSNEHMTIAYLGDVCLVPDSKYLKGLKNISAKITGDDFFGPNKDIHVWLLELISSKKEIVEIWKEYNVEQEHTKGLKEPRFHITIKPNSPERKVGDVIQFSTIFGKTVGKKEPYFVKEI